MIFDRFCKEHDLKYSLADGTLLGAMRHGDFVPWDDDADVMMTRAEFEKFKKVVRRDDAYKLFKVLFTDRFATKESFEKGEMYFVYNKNSQLQDGYDLVLCNSENTHEVIQLEKDELPVGAGVDSVLRKDNDKYVLDELGTNEVLEKMKEILEEMK